MFNLSQKVAVITGASSGLGRDLAVAFAQQGANLAILARREERLMELKTKLEKEYKIKVLPIKCDVTDTASITAAAKKVKSEYDHINILLNCAGASKDKGVLDMQDDEWDFTISTDLTSVFKMTRAFAKLMPESGGRVINIASMYGLVGNTEIPTIAYHSSKGGVVNFTRAAAAELATKNITVNAICPGYFETELTKAVLDTDSFQQFAKTHVPMQRYGKPGELNAAAIFLASDEASYVTGAILPVDGGYTCI
ncbi:3-oxoacyl-ACP reductase FabG [Candidatus Saccharibacteria bacterium]|nr:3-oxoacyl-ACP reductase FabG [Candidatus Saccharibacteria bacterium]